ncbi:hypothetical protein GQ53DRAFT_120445 [Thozetella sp. PMI_491]|nr:hypothetical protein GQ53DRAFT_120445 [Thozetella sp. PMI_491]
MDERPAKRARQACDRCRRKKTRCPGEKPVCSFCSRLSQTCSYSDYASTIQQTYGENARKARDAVICAPTETRFGALEEKVDRMFNAILHAVSAQNATSINALSPGYRERGDLSPDIAASPSRELEISADYAIASDISGCNISPWPPALVSPRHLSCGPIQSSLPQSVRQEVVKLYIQHCASQPVSLFDTGRLLGQFDSYSVAIQKMILGTGLRFSQDLIVVDNQERLAVNYIDEARQIIFEDIGNAYGTMHVSLMQGLCLSIFFDLSSGSFQRARLHAGLGMSLYRSTQLRKKPVTMSEVEVEDQRRCYWCLYHLRCLTNIDPDPLFSASQHRPPFPSSLTVDLKYSESIPPSTSRPGIGLESHEDSGIIGYTLQLAELWQTTLNYVTTLSKGGEAPWTPNSTQFQIAQRIMELESRLCKNHGNAHVRFAEHRAEAVQVDSEYWKPWLSLQFTYHATMCLLHHPFVYFDLVASEPSSSSAAFLETASDLALLHAKRLIRLVDTLEQKSIQVSDPFLGYCVAIAATVLLCLGEVKDGDAKTPPRVAKCYNFIIGLAKFWLITRRLAKNLIAAIARTDTREVRDGTTHMISGPDAECMWQILKFCYDTDADAEELKPGTLPGSLGSEAVRHLLELEQCTSSDMATSRSLQGTIPNETEISSAFGEAGFVLYSEATISSSTEEGIGPFGLGGHTSSTTVRDDSNQWYCPSISLHLDSI